MRDDSILVRTYEGGQETAQATIRRGARRSWVLSSIAVRKAYRGKGLGLQVLRRALDLAQRRGIRRLYFDNYNPTFWGHVAKAGYAQVRKVGVGRGIITLTGGTGA